MDSTAQELIALTDRVLAGEEITREEAEQIILTKDEDCMLLMALADKVRQRYNGDRVDFCAIINARSGRCPEDCKFCAQSAHHCTGVKEYPLLDEDSLVAAARRAKEAGAVRFSIVTSGRNQGNPREFEQILAALRRIREEVGLEICCSLGLISDEQAVRLKEVGVTRYHANIETAPSHFDAICGTHNFQDKLKTMAAAKAAGIRICSGGILGMGETPQQRVEMAFTLKALGVDSIPLNILNPIPGTPFENMPPLSALDILRTFAMFRFVLPRALIRTAGGREVNLRDLQAFALNAGLNGIMVGNYLTTAGRSPEQDITMVRDLGRRFSHPRPLPAQS